MANESACSFALGGLTPLRLALLIVGLSGCAGQVVSDVSPIDDAGGVGEGGAGGDPETLPRSTVGGQGGTLLSTTASGGSGGAPLSGDAGIRPLADAANSADADPDLPPPGWVPAIVAVGDKGVRVLSRTLGATWEAQTQLGGGGDDGNLLRGVAYGRGIWVAAGWRLFTSRDGAAWTEHKQEPCKLMQSIAFGKDMFLAACAPEVYRSNDGAKWTEHGKFGTFGGHAYIIFGNGKFAGSGDDGKSYVSDDGIKWTLLPGVDHVAYCLGEFRSRGACPSSAWGHGVFLREQNNSIARSTNGTAWTPVLQGVGITSFGFGYAPAQ